MIERTPLLIPSFSSKGFPEVKKIIDYSKEVITDVILVSAYDLFYQNISPPFDFVPLIFLDSGGYEASKDTELSDFEGKEHKEKEWSQTSLQKVASEWKQTTPTVLISYDHPKERVSIKQQIDRAKALMAQHPTFIKEILLKPHSSQKVYLDIDVVTEHVHDLASFDVIGVTEKELGNSIIARMKSIAKIRMALTKAGLDTPIHVFGSLDTVTTPMYFVAGADIFDGLTWLRFAFYQGQTIYKQNYGALEYGAAVQVHLLDGHCLNDNYYYMKSLEDQMRTFLPSRDWTKFQHHAAMLERAYNTTIEALGG